MITDEVRLKRVILGPESNAIPQVNITVVTGLFNAIPFLDLILHNLQTQAGQFPILLIDNLSVDGTWEAVTKWTDIFGDRLTLVRNPLNLGGWGSIAANLDLIKTPWFVTMHQDDRYEANHVSALGSALEGLEDSVVCVCTDMGSLLADGTENSLKPPRPSWGLERADRITLFLSNLRLHNVPNPASAFRTSKFDRYSGPWHSTAFPDTEWLLRALMESDVKLLPIVTMQYRENPTSESHSIRDSDRDKGAFLALNRIFNSDAYIRFCRQIPSEDRHGFAMAIFSGIKVRIKTHSYSELLTLVAAEQMVKAWDYGDPYTNHVLSDLYQTAGGEGAASLLGRVSHYLFATPNATPLNDAKESPTFELLHESHHGRARSTVKVLCLRVFSMVPFALRKKMFSAFRNSSLIPSTSAWFIRWKRNGK